MEEPKRKVSAKKFLEDFRSGKPDEELMEIYGLDRKNLNRLFKKLITKGLLDADEVRLHKIRDRTGDTSDPEASVELESSVRAIFADAGAVDDEEADSAKCPQCGAPASDIGLTCPECGTMLPGSRRWETVDRQESVFHRLSPLAWGCILVATIGVILYLLLASSMHTATPRRADTQSGTVSEVSGPAMTPQQAAKRAAVVKYRNDLQAEVNRLIALDILSHAEADYSVFTAGAMWAGLSTNSRREHLSQIAAAMSMAEIRSDFEVVDGGGFTVATVKNGAIELVDAESSMDEFEAGVTQQENSPGADRDPPPEELEKQAGPEGRRQQIKDLPKR